MKKFIFAVVCALCLGAVAGAQDPAPAEPNAGVKFAACASYSVNGKAEDQATEFCARVPFADRWAAQYTVVFAPNLNETGVNFHLGELRYSRNLSDFFKKSSAQFNPERVELSGFGGIGTARNAVEPGNASFAWSAGGCGSFQLSDNTKVEACYRYVRSRIVAGGVLLRGDHQLPIGMIFSW